DVARTRRAPARFPRRTAHTPSTLPPPTPKPEEFLSFDGFIAEIVTTYKVRNEPPLEWAE
ncbi:MAG TPA: hypothetical protein VHJ69_07010, partial [Gemmatimonadales bacterium]|nr:hypothetical protein [Gemmatimonadales bacterium]